MKLTLHRQPSTPAGTFGILAVGNDPLCHTLERPWDDNKPRLSCVPAGLYDCVRHNGSHFQNVWELCGVPGREAILIHPGNSIRDTEGCILVGQECYQNNLLRSRAAIDDLRAKLPDSFTLEIIDGPK